MRYYFVFQGRLMPEDGAALQQALEAVLDVLHQKQAANREAGAAPNQSEQAPAMVGDETFPRKGEEEDEDARFSIEDYMDGSADVSAEVWDQDISAEMFKHNDEGPEVAPPQAPLPRLLPRVIEG